MDIDDAETNQVSLEALGIEGRHSSTDCNVSPNEDYLRGLHEVIGLHRLLCHCLHASSGYWRLRHQKEVKP